MSNLGNIEFEFYRLRLLWKSETMFHSSSKSIYGNQNYKDILALGKDVIPLIIKHYMSDECWENWSPALELLLSINPVQKESLGDYYKTRSDWKSYLRNYTIDSVLD